MDWWNVGGATIDWCKCSTIEFQALIEYSSNLNAISVAV